LDHPRCRRRCGNVWVHDGEIQRARAAGGEPGGAPAELLCADSEFGDQARHDVFRQVVGGIPRGPFTHSVWTRNAPPDSTKTATGAFPPCAEAKASNALTASPARTQSAGDWWRTGPAEDRPIRRGG
jgi:hypothetical protein